MRQIKNLVKDAFIPNALRQSGHDALTALADIIDNSIEDNVKSSVVSINIDHDAKDGRIKGISIVDNGCGMMETVLSEAMRIGCDTGKDKIKNYGCYGSGLKVAALSMGQTLEVYSMTENSDVLNYGILTVNPKICEKHKEQDVYCGIRQYKKGSKEFNNFVEQVSERHGTIINISDIDRIGLPMRILKNRLIEHIGVTFAPQIRTNEVRFFIEGKEVPYIEAKGNIVLFDKNVNCAGFECHVIVTYTPPKLGSFDDDMLIDEASVEVEDGIKRLRRTLSNQGIYVYRNNRLVGRALTLGLYRQKHSTLNGFRAFIKYHGDSDSIMGSSFTKIVREVELPSDIALELKKILQPLWMQCYHMDLMRQRSKPEDDPEKKKFYKDATTKLNSTFDFNLSVLGIKSEKTEKEPKEHNSRGPQKNPSISRNKNNWLGGIREVSLGNAAHLFENWLENNKMVFYINTDHPSYKNFYNTLSIEQKYWMIISFACDSFAKQDIGYWNDDTCSENINRYQEFYDIELKKAFRNLSMPGQGKIKPVAFDDSEEEDAIDVSIAQTIKV